MKDMLLFTALGMAVIVTLAVGVGNAEMWYKCRSYQQATGKQTKYKLLDACYVKTNEGWQRWDEYKIRAAASEGLKG